MLLSIQKPLFGNEKEGELYMNVLIVIAKEPSQKFLVNLHTEKLKKEVRAGMQEPEANQEGAKKTFSAEEKMACSIEAMRNGGECEACQ